MSPAQSYVPTSQGKPRPPTRSDAARTALPHNKTSAGAGATGLFGFLILFAVASVFFVAEFYFVSMFIVSIALLVYVTGSEVATILLSSVGVFFSNKHLTAKAVQLQDNLSALRDVLHLQRNAQGEVTNAPIEAGSVVRLPDTALARDIKTIAESDKSPSYAEYVAHSYCVECHALYDHTSAHLAFVSGAMPLFGLIGTIVGLIAMFDSLGGDVTVEALAPQLALALKTTLYGAVFSSLYRIVGSRFEQRLRALTYDFDTFVRAIDIVIANKARVEVFR